MRPPRDADLLPLLGLACLLVFGGTVAARWQIYKGYEPGLTRIAYATFLRADSLAYRATVRGLVREGTIDPSETMLDGALYRTEPGGPVPLEARDVPLTRSKAALTRGGALVPKHPLLFPLALAPAYWLANEVGLLAFNVAQCLLLVLAVYGLARTRYRPGAAFAGAAAFLALSPVRPYSYNLSPDVFGALLVVGGGALVGLARSRRGWLLGGAALGLAVWMRPFNVVGVLALLPAAVESLRGRRLLPRLGWAGAAFLAAAGGFLLLNLHWFGHPLVTTYDRTVVMIDGVRHLGSHRDEFNRPLLASIGPTLLDPEVGLFRTAPYWPLLLPALLTARGARAWALALAGWFAVPVLALVPYDHWATSTEGNRFLLVPAAVAALGVSWLVQALRARDRVRGRRRDSS